MKPNSHIMQIPAQSNKPAIISYEATGVWLVERVASTS